MISHAPTDVHPGSRRDGGASDRARPDGRAGEFDLKKLRHAPDLNFTTAASPTPNKNQVETMVAGVALFDYDGDGYLDIYLVNGAAIPSLQERIAASIGIGCFTTTTTAPSPTLPRKRA